MLHGPAFVCWPLISSNRWFSQLMISLSMVNKSWRISYRKLIVNNIQQAVCLVRSNDIFPSFTQIQKSLASVWSWVTSEYVNQPNKIQLLRPPWMANKQRRWRLNLWWRSHRKASSNWICWERRGLGKFSSGRYGLIELMATFHHHKSKAGGRHCWHEVTLLSALYQCECKRL